MNAGDSIEVVNSGWSFNGQAAANFDPHVSKSVPLYDEGHHLVLKLSDFFLYKGSICYELGCSTAALTEKLADWNRHKSCDFIGVDIEPDMTRIAKEKCKRFPNVHILQDNVVEMDLKRSDLIVCYYTLQFIRPQVRQLVINKIYQALNWGGAFICFEKVRASDARFQDLAVSIYQDFKIGNGYTPEEVYHKAGSLKGVLEPFSTQGNLDLMKRAGFVDILTIMKYVCFEGFLAIK